MREGWLAGLYLSHLLLAPSFVMCCLWGRCGLSAREGGSVCTFLSRRIVLKAWRYLDVRHTLVVGALCFCGVSRLFWDLELLVGFIIQSGYGNPDAFFFTWSAELVLDGV